MSCSLLRVGMLAAALVVAPALGAQTLPPAAARSAELARLLANGGPASGTMDALLSPLKGKRTAPPETGKKVAQPPTYAVRAFDDLFYVGTDYVGTWILKTPAGLLLIDAMTKPDDLDGVLLPGMHRLGLDPATIRELLITHGHWDHYGAAQAIVGRYHARLWMSAGDHALAVVDAGRRGLPPPPAALPVTDGMKLDFGGRAIKLYITPGHTPATVSVLLPVHDRGVGATVALWGGNRMPDTLGPTPDSGGLLAYRASMVRFAALSVADGATGIISSHPLGDGTHEKVRTPRGRTEHNPWLIGTDAVLRLDGAYIAAADALIAKAEADGR